MQQNYKKLKIFQGLEYSDIEQIIASAEKETFSADRLIIYEGERIDNKWYIILSGSVNIKIHNIEIANLGVWEIFGEIGLLVGDKRKATVRASTATEVMVIDFDKLMLIVDNDGNQINKEMIRRMQQNLLLE